MNITLKEIADAVSGELHGDASLTVDGVSTDSRKVKDNELFVPLKGERYDGHDYLSSIEGHCVAYLADSSWLESGGVSGSTPFIAVEDTLKGLGDIAACWRRRFEIPVIGVTGSNGKTTTKEMLASILYVGCKGLATEGNLNNLIGLPQMIFQLEPSVKWGVFEMGMSESGEIDRLAEVAYPQIGIITNANPSHLESMKSVEEVARAKGELFLRIPSGGWAIYNSDDEKIRNLPSAKGVNRLGFGIESGDVAATEIMTLGEKGYEFTLRLPNRKLRVYLPVPGKHNLMDALAAAAASFVLKVPDSQIQEGFARFKPYRQRFNIIEVEGFTIVDDTYNANPSSMLAALSTLSECAQGRRKTAVLGEMLELGGEEEELHRETGRIAGKMVDRVVVIGKLGDKIAQGAIEAGLQPEAVFSAADHKSAAELVIDGITAGEWILVKGSRGMKMENVVNHIKSAFTKKEE